MINKTNLINSVQFIVSKVTRVFVFPPNDSYFHSKGKGKEPGSNMLDFQKLDKKIQTFNQKKLQRKKEKKKNLHSNFLKNRQKLFKNYIKTAQKLYRNYLKDAHSKIHKIH